MPGCPCSPISEKMKSRFEAFMKRNIVIIAICVPLGVIAIIAAIVQH